LGFPVISSAAVNPSLHLPAAEGRALGYNVVAARAHSAITVVVAAAASSAVPKSIISIVYRFFSCVTNHRREAARVYRRTEIPACTVRTYTASVVLRPF